MADEANTVSIPGWVAKKLGDWTKENGFGDPITENRGRGQRLTYDVNDGQKQALLDQVKTLGAPYQKWAEKQEAKVAA